MYILGIHDGHLATASLLKDGKIIYCASEERFSKNKNQSGLPVKAIQECLDFANIKTKDINAVVFAGNLMPPTVNHNNSSSLYTHLYHILKPFLTRLRLISINYPAVRAAEEILYCGAAELIKPLTVRQRTNELLSRFTFDPKSVYFIDHHLAHAYAPLYSSGLITTNQDLLILTCDGEGDKLCATVNIFHKNELKVVSKTLMTNSLGNLYRSITKFLGMKPLEDEYKVMGLAAYVNDKRADKLYQVLKPLFEVDKNTLKIKAKVNSQNFKLGYLDNLLKEYRFDHIGAAVQKLTEDILAEWVKAAVKKTGIRNVLLGGGVFMNVKANQKIAELPEIEKIYIMPSCGDESNAIGACYFGYWKLTGNHPLPLFDLYLGSSFSEKEIEYAFKKYSKRDLIITKPRDLEKTAAKLLSKGEIIARCSGRMEFGARALGNRSILADPTNLEAIEIINRMIKSRDFWMPFAPVVLAEKADLYIVNPKNIPAPHMIMTFDSTIKAQKDLRAAMHVYDKTIRPQVLQKQANPRYYKIIEEFSKITGRYGLLNTSFNLHGSPIVCTPEDALKTFDHSGLEYLILGSFLVKKHQGEIKIY